MTIQNEFENLTENLKQQRDELNLKMHLATMEAKEEWENAENKWGELKIKIDDIADETKETGEEFINAAKTIAEEIAAAHKRIKDRLSD